MIFLNYQKNNNAPKYRFYTVKPKSSNDSSVWNYLYDDSKVSCVLEPRNISKDVHKTEVLDKLENLKQSIKDLTYVILDYDEWRKRLPKDYWDGFDSEEIQ